MVGVEWEVTHMIGWADRFFITSFLRHVVTPHWISSTPLLSPITSVNFQCQVFIGTSFLPPPPAAAIHPESGNCSLCRNVWKASTFDAAHPRKPKFWIKLQPRKSKDKKLYVVMVVQIKVVKLSDFTFMWGGKEKAAFILKFWKKVTDHWK
jgi:mRNA-degrading endonuclease toxin of MazEF toxin-antitoxin module